MKQGFKKRFLVVMLSLMLMASSLSGCASGNIKESDKVESQTAKTPGQSTYESDVQSSENEVQNTSEDAEGKASGAVELSAVSTEEAPKKKIENYRNNEDGHHEFQPHVFSKKYLEYHGEGVMQSFFNMVDALRAGEDTFECTDENAYGWCTGGRLINFFFPVATDCIQPMQGTGTDAFKNGVGKINYLIPKEEFLERERQFEEMVVSILNNCVSDDYDDFETCLSLYEYITMNYKYDYYVYEHLNDLPFDYTSTYRCFTEKKGICCEIAGMYNYLLLQCGVDSEESGGDHREIESHAWVFVTIDGESYHIDPTWGLTYKYAPLTYFMMTDKIRDTRDGFPVEKMDIGGGGDESRKLFDFHATDDRYQELWEGNYMGMDRENKKIIYFLYDEDDRKEFYYGGEG
ncbi:MAG: transglutaminase domain-containing protein [Lachnospiraceae bacterium]|nr:transglutaminase domain-containing protein [Lachnospiraceae bacterium]